MPADGLAPNGARTSAGTAVMNKSRSCIYKKMANWWVMSYWLINSISIKAPGNVINIKLVELARCGYLNWHGHYHACKCPWGDEPSGAIVIFSTSNIFLWRSMILKNVHSWNVGVKLEMLVWYSRFAPSQWETPLQSNAVYGLECDMPL